MSCNYEDENIQVNSVLVSFRATVTVKDPDTQIYEIYDISGASVKTLRFNKPDGTSVDKTATFVTDGTDGKIEYLSEAGFLNIPGKWRMQGFVTIGSGYYPTNIETFKVKDNLA